MNPCQPAVSKYVMRLVPDCVRYFRLPSNHCAAKTEFCLTSTWGGTFKLLSVLSSEVATTLNLCLSVTGETNTGWPGKNALADSTAYFCPSRFSIKVVSSVACTCGVIVKLIKALSVACGRFR